VPTPDQRLYVGRPRHQLFAAVSEHLLGPRIDQHDVPVAVDDHDRIGPRVEQITELRLRSTQPVRVRPEQTGQDEERPSTRSVARNIERGGPDPVADCEQCHPDHRSDQADPQPERNGEERNRKVVQHREPESRGRDRELQREDRREQPRRCDDRRLPADIRM
jgi:hypothetical protein